MAHGHTVHQFQQYRYRGDGIFGAELFGSVQADQGQFELVGLGAEVIVEILGTAFGQENAGILLHAVRGDVNDYDAPLPESFLRFVQYGVLLQKERIVEAWGKKDDDPGLPPELV